jgi:hypothetical protein
VSSLYSPSCFQDTRYAFAFSLITAEENDCFGLAGRKTHALPSGGKGEKAV